MISEQKTLFAETIDKKRVFGTYNEHGTIDVHVIEDEFGPYPVIIPKCRYEPGCDLKPWSWNWMQHDDPPSRANVVDALIVAVPKRFLKAFIRKCRYNIAVNAMESHLDPHATMSAVATHVFRSSMLSSGPEILSRMARTARLARYAYTEDKRMSDARSLDEQASWLYRMMNIITENYHKIQRITTRKRE